MDKDIRESIALARFQIISPILAEPKRAQNDYFREQTGKGEAAILLRSFAVQLFELSLPSLLKKTYPLLIPEKHLPPNL